MDKKTIISVIVIIIGVTALVWWSKSVDKRESSVNDSTQSSLVKMQDALVLPEAFYDFGSISMKDGNVSTTFTVSNSSEQDINLEKLFTSCMCTNAYLLNANGSKKGPFGMPGHGVMPKVNELVEAGESLDIEVVFDPNAHGPAGVGSIERVVILEDENKNMVEFKFTANVTP